jgi:hypothetical protein
MQIEYVLPLSAFDTPAVEAAFRLYIEKCQEEIAAGNDYPYVAHERRMLRLLMAVEKAEAQSVEQLRHTAPRKKPRQ